MANKRIKKVSVYIQKYYGQKTDSPGKFPKKLIGEFRSTRMAREAVETFGSMTHVFNNIMLEHDGKDAMDEHPCITRESFGDGRTEWGYEFVMREKGLFKSEPNDIYRDFKVYYTVEYYE